jgi:uncharacterized protein
MKNLSAPLTDDELDRLSDFLLNRVDETHDANPDFNAGIIDLSELDGFLTAIVSGPNAIPPSVWLRVVWGDEEPVWESTSEFESIFALFLRHMNSIAAILADDGDNFEPMFSERRANEQTHLIVDDWCYGYMMGVALDERAWQLTSPAVRQLLAPIELYGTQNGWKVLDGLEQSEASRMRDAIPQAVRDVFGHWLQQRMPPAQPTRRASPKVGRNDPCPCGSGKKYKHCCLQ